MRPRDRSRSLITILAVLCSFAGRTHAQVEIILPAHPVSRYHLTPGVYFYADWRGGGVLRVTKAENGRFVSGSLELLRINSEGQLLDLKSEVSASAEVSPCPPEPSYCVQHKSNMTAITFGPPTTILDITDKPLSDMLGKVDSYMLPEGIRIDWTGSASATGQDRTGSYALFLPGTEEEYQEILDEYRAMAVLAQKDIKIKIAASDLIKLKLEAFMKQSDSWMGEAPDAALQVLVEKSKALYSQERQALAASRIDDARFALMKINAIQLDAQLVGKSLQDEEYFAKNAGSSVESADFMSPCWESNDYFGSGPPQACSTLPPLIAAYKVRRKALNDKMSDVSRARQQEISSLECIAQNAGYAVDPQQTRVSPRCQEAEQKPEATTGTASSVR